MQEILNEAIIPMLNDGLLSMKRVRDLIYIKDFIDRVTTTKFIEDIDVHNLCQKFGVMPNIITWGDYFQTDLASALQIVSDEEFNSVLETIKFDIISSWIIFSEKESSFFNWVEDLHSKITAEKKRGFTDEEAEILHLKIMKDYFCDMGLVDNFTDNEMEWYSTFREAKAV